MQSAHNGYYKGSTPFGLNNKRKLKLFYFLNIKYLGMLILIFSGVSEIRYSFILLKIWGHRRNGARNQKPKKLIYKINYLNPMKLKNLYMNVDLILFMDKLDLHSKYIFS